MNIFKKIFNGDEVKDDDINISLFLTLDKTDHYSLCAGDPAVLIDGIKFILQDVSNAIKVYKSDKYTPAIKMYRDKCNKFLTDLGLPIRTYVHLNTFNKDEAIEKLQKYFDEKVGPGKLDAKSIKLFVKAQEDA